MGNIISVLQEIFTGKDNFAGVGLNSFRDAAKPVSNPVKKTVQPQELKLSDLMRKGSF